MSDFLITDKHREDIPDELKQYLKGLKYCNSVNKMTYDCMDLNEKAEINRYSACSEEELREKQEERITGTWIRI